MGGHGGLLPGHHPHGVCQDTQDVSIRIRRMAWSRKRDRNHRARCQNEKLYFLHWQFFCNTCFKKTWFQTNWKLCEDFLSKWTGIFILTLRNNMKMSLKLNYQYIVQKMTFPIAMRSN